MNSTIEKKPEAGVSLHGTDLGFETDILVAGMLAMAYAQGTRSPSAGWARGLRIRPITIGSDQYIANYGRHPETKAGGVILSVKTGAFGGDKSSRTFFIPFTAMAKMTLTLPGCEEV